MLDKRTAQLAAIEMPASISHVFRGGINFHTSEVSESESSSIISDCGNKRCQSDKIPRREKYVSTGTGKGKVLQTLPETLKVSKKNASNCARTTKTARKSERANRNVKGSINIGEKINKCTTDVVISIDQFMPKFVDKMNKRVKDNRHKSGKLKHKDEDILSSLTKPVFNTKKARPKPSLRQLKRMSVLKPKMRGWSAHVAVNYNKCMDNKAGNNNWMLDNDEASNIANSLVVPTCHTKSRASSFSSFIQPNSSSKTVFRASSSDDSSCFSNTSTQSSNVMSTNKRNSQTGLYAAQHIHFPCDSKHRSASSRLCGICRTHSLEHGWRLCKGCSGQARQNEVRSGPLNELKAYAQSIANSVKKILQLNLESEECDELEENLAPKNKDENIQNMSQTEKVHIKSGPEIALHRYMTENNMASLLETRSRKILNKSVSYDGRVGTRFGDKDKRSSLHWLSQDKVAVSDSFSKLTNSVNVSNFDEDCFSPGKECKHCIMQDCDKNPKNGKIDKSKTRISLKQLARVERARTDGDLRANPLQQSMPNKKIGKDEHKKGLEFQRNRSKTFHEVDADIDEFYEYSPKQLEETDSRYAIKISRQKVIHEGSPVDPPYNFDKKMEDNKGRKAVFIRSATAPYRNHSAKKDIAAGEKLSTIEGVIKTNKTNTKSTVRTNKASTLRKENSLSDRKKAHEYLEPQPVSWIDDTPSLSTLSFTRRRSTSYDGRKPLHPKRELHRSISWSMVEGDDEGSKQRRAAASASNISAKRQKEHDGRFSMNVMPSTMFRERGQKEHQVKYALSTDTFHRDSSTDNFKHLAQEISFEKSPLEIPKDIIVPCIEELVELTQPQSVSYFNSMRYYGHDTENRLSPCIEEDLVDDQSETNLGTDSYYCYTETAATNKQLVGSELTIDAENSISFYKSVDNEGVYHDQVTPHGDSEVSNTKASIWYSPLQDAASDQWTMTPGERSLESKSSTSFHLVTNTKSSHSDEALMKYSEAWEHTTSRKQSMYTETDVDTGLIYHLAKRQTTRAHIPPYHDLTNSSRDIYTMSGDVNTSTSSASSISAKSEISECPYTGGFYKEDPFYSSTNSKESSSYIYFEPDGQSQLVSSEMDIYTGSIFNSNQNKLLLAQDTIPNKTNTVTEYIKDGSTNNTSRSLMGRTQRHLKYRPHNDAITVRNNAPTWEYLPQPVLICGGVQSYDASNNSNNWGATDEFDGTINQGSIVTKSKEPMYTDYDPGMRPEFHVKTIEKTGPVFDFLKYENSREPTPPGHFPSHHVDNSSGDNIWYSGLLRSPSNEGLEKQYIRRDQSPDETMFSWQYSDDYYTSTVRPRIGKSKNKYAVGAQGKITSDTNNNHFEDIYTGSYGVQNAPPRVQEQPAPVRQPSTDNWYLSQSTPKLTSSTFYDQKYETLYATPPSATKSSLDIHESTKGSRASSSIFAQDSSSYSESSAYVTGDILRKYDQSHILSSSMMDEPVPIRSRVIEKPAHEETESYFNYASNKSSDRGFYTVDDDTYSFEPKVVKETRVVPVIPEIKTVGGIVCRENVANKEDYAEDINRDLEPGPWTPFSFRCTDEARYSTESGGSSNATRSSESLVQGQNIKHTEDTSYANNRIYDNIGTRNKWREMATKKDNEVVRTKDTSHHKAHQGGDTGKQDHMKSRNLPDIIPDRARGKRTNSTITKPAAAEGSSVHKGSRSGIKPCPAAKRNGNKYSLNQSYPDNPVLHDFFSNKNIIQF